LSFSVWLLLPLGRRGSYFGAAAAAAPRFEIRGGGGGGGPPAPPFDAAHQLLISSYPVYDDPSYAIPFDRHCRSTLLECALHCDGIDLICRSVQSI